MRDVVVLVPLKEMSPDTVAVPVLIFHELFRVEVVGWLKVTSPLTVNDVPAFWVIALLVPGAAKVSPAMVAFVLRVTTTAELMVIASVAAGNPPAPVHPVHVPAVVQFPVAVALQAVGDRVWVLPSKA